MSRTAHFMRLLAPYLFTASLAGFAVVAHAQNVNAEFNGGFPVAPTGLQNLPLEDGPWTYRTGEDMNILVELVTRMEYAMAMEFLPNNDLLVIARRGLLYRISGDEKTEITGGPDSVFIGESGGIGSIHGYMDIALHPDFENTGYVYIVYTRPDEDLGAGVLTLGRGRLAGNTLEDFEIVYDTVNVSGAGVVLFGADDKLYFSVSHSNNQDLTSNAGKILRLNDDGSIPDDNPFVDTPYALPEIYTLGHRSSLGMTLHEATGNIWESENGPNGGDELNILKAGADYGWPSVSFGRNYSGPWQTDTPDHYGYEMPDVIWIPSVAVSGLTFYTGDELYAWTGDLFVGALREGEVNGTGHLERILFNSDMEELRRESLLVDLHKRIRDVAQGPDGFLYVALEDSDGGVLRIKPAP